MASVLFSLTVILELPVQMLYSFIKKAANENIISLTIYLIKPLVEIHFPMHCFLYLAVSGSFHAFLQIFKQNLILYLFTDI